MSGGAKAGLAIGILLVIALIAGGILFLYAKKKRQSEDHEKAENEKFKGMTAMNEKAPAPAPRLSLGPVTQFLPSLEGAKKRLSGGNLLGSAKSNATVGTVGSRDLTGAPPAGRSAWERRGKPVGTSDDANPFSDPVNPFSDKNASTPGTPTISITPPQSSHGSEAAEGAPVGAAAAGAAAAAVVSGKARGNHHDTEVTRGNATIGTENNEAPKSPPGTGASDSVYRVQMDFSPSMEDELGLQVGQVIRIIHEYDDGWVSVFPKTILLSLM